MCQIQFRINLEHGDSTFQSSNEIQNVANTKLMHVPSGLAAGLPVTACKHGDVFVLYGAKALSLKQLIETSQVAHIDNDQYQLSPKDLYCFEANLYKHWLEPNPSSRIHVSFGYLLPYADLGLNNQSPRARLSDRIYKRFVEMKKIPLKSDCPTQPVICS